MAAISTYVQLPFPVRQYVTSSPVALEFLRSQEGADSVPLPFRILASAAAQSYGAVSRLCRQRLDGERGTAGRTLWGWGAAGERVGEGGWELGKVAGR